MTQEQHPITPPPELVQQWTQTDENERFEHFYRRICTQAARWGADQELDACCEVLARELICDGKHVATDLRTVRRPKPPSLKEQALQELDLLTADATTHGLGFDASAIRRAIESIPDEQ